MKSFNFRSLAVSVCATLCAFNPLHAADQIVPRDVLTAEEKNQIHEERIEQAPAEVLKFGEWFGVSSFGDEHYLFQIHKDADHYMIGIKNFGEAILLHDESEWSVGLFDRSTVKGWKSDHVLFIKPNTSLFSFYNYEIQNRTTYEKADINHLAVPLFANAYSLEVVGIDYFSRLITLNDGTVWQVSPSDFSFKTWLLGDRIIVGVNKSYRMGSYIHILINASITGAPYCEANYIAF